MQNILLDTQPNSQQINLKDDFQTSPQCPRSIACGFFATAQKSHGHRIQGKSLNILEL
jgi:hypothetical protein